MNIFGDWFPPNSASRKKAVLKINNAHASIHGEDNELWQGDASAIEVSSRVGNIPRKLSFEDGSVFSTEDNDTIDLWLKHIDHKAHKGGILHALESRWKWVFASVLILIVATVLTFTWGLPSASEKIAKSLPTEVNKSLGSGTLATLDKFLFKPSKVSPAKQQAMRRHFKENLLPKNKEGFDFKLNFRHMPGGFSKDGQANAFALPSGEIVVTDRLLSLSASQDEIDAILLHEIGHVIHRHSMRKVIQSSAISVALILVTGDISGVEEWTIALPGFLLDSNYSRDFETEADLYAFERMLERNQDPKNFGTMLARIVKDVGIDSDSKKDSDNDTDADSKSSSDEEKDEKPSSGWTKYLSSHPASEDRIKQAEEYSERFKAQQAK